MGRYYDDFLEHHGVLGMKWGVHRYQNPDGSLTAEGKKRYYANSSSTKKRAKGYQRYLNDLDEDISSTKVRKRNEELRMYNEELNKTGSVTGKHSKKYDDLDSKLNEYSKRGQDVLKKLDEMGYSVKSSNARRYWREGAANFETSSNSGNIDGTKYKVAVRKSKKYEDKASKMWAKRDAVSGHGEKMSEGTMHGRHYTVNTFDNKKHERQYYHYQNKALDYSDKARKLKSKGK